MELVRGLHNLRSSKQGCVATIGNFDGVHRGHQCILRQVKEKAAELRVPSTVILFEPQPQEFFAGESAPPRLTRFREKLELLAQQGIERVVCLAFNKTLRSLSAEQFIQRVLLDGLSVRYLVVGDDFRFGCDRKGDFSLLQEAGRQHGFEVTHTRTFMVEGKRVSSTRVREALDAGDFELARRLLGRPFAICGRVIHGQKLGRQLGVPTANLSLQNRVPPLNGVYAVQVRTAQGTIEQGVANIGMRPTVNGRRPMLEVHLFDFSGDLYGQRLKVVFCSKLRDEVKFDGLEALRAQIRQDMEQARDYFAIQGGMLSDAPADNDP